MGMGRTSISIFFCLLFACGCVKIPTDEANCRMLETPCIDTEEALGQNGFILGDFPDPCWWEMFDDPQLTCLIERALEQSPTMAKVAAIVSALRLSNCPRLSCVNGATTGT